MEDKDKKTGSSTDEKKKRTKSWILGGIVVILLLAVTLTPRSSRSTLGVQPQTVATQIDTTKVVSVGTDWYNPNIENRKIKISGYPLTGGIEWQVRVNGNDKNIFDMPPVDSPTVRHLSVTGVIMTLEYRFKPGQQVKNGQFEFQFKPYS